MKINRSEDFSTRYDAWQKTYFKAGKSFTACVPFMSGLPRKIHIRHVFPSIYADRQLIVYAVYGKTKQWWHEFMCTNVDMCGYVYDVERRRKKQPA